MRVLMPFYDSLCQRMSYCRASGKAHLSTRFTCGNGMADSASILQLAYGDLIEKERYEQRQKDIVGLQRF